MSANGTMAASRIGGKEASAKRRWLELLALVILTVSIWLPRASALDRFLTADEFRWVDRSMMYVSALARGDYAGTFQREHPGVTTMLAGSAGIAWHTLIDEGQGAGRSSLADYVGGIKKHGRLPLDLFVAGRSFVVVAGTISLVLSFLFARRMLGSVPAFVGFMLIAFNPFHLALSRLLHLDGLLSSTLLLALLAFLSFLHTRRPVDLVVSGIAAGLGGLTKSPAVFVVPVVGLLAVASIWWDPPVRKEMSLAARLWRIAWPVLVWGLVGLLAFAVLWPAMWVDPVGTLSRVFSEALTHAQGGHENAIFFNGQVYEDGRVSTPWFYPITYLWRSTPVVLAGLGLAIVAFVLRREPLGEAKARRVVAGLVLFVAVFTLLQNVGLKKFDRYLVPVYPPLDLIAGMGWVAAAAWAGGRLPRLLGRNIAPFLLGGVIALQVLGALRTYPYYLSYYNPVMGGGARAPAVMQIGWGEGLDEAARYLDERAGEHLVSVASWYSASLAPLFSDQTRRTVVDTEFASLDEVLDLDYAVVYIHQWQRSPSRSLLRYLDQLTPIHSVWLNGMEYVRIYKVKRLPPVPEPSQLVAEGNLADRARLVGVDPPLPLTVQAGATLPVTLTWESVGIFADDYTVFAHLAGNDKRPVAQTDSQPLGGIYPTRLWDVGERVADAYELDLPDDLPPGEYELLVGMYLLSTGERLPLLGPDGQVLGDSISVGRVTVMQPGE